MRILLAMLLLFSLAYAEYASTTLVAVQDHPQDLNPLATSTARGSQDTPSDLNPKATTTLYDIETPSISIDLNVIYTTQTLEYRITTDISNPAFHVLVLDDKGNTTYTSTSPSGQTALPSKEFTVVVVYAGVRVSPLLYVFATNNANTITLKARLSGTYIITPLLGIYSPIQVTLGEGEITKATALPGLVALTVRP